MSLSAVIASTGADCRRTTCDRKAIPMPARIHVPLTMLLTCAAVQAENIPANPWLNAGNMWYGHTQLDTGLSTNFDNLNNWTTNTSGWTGRWPGIFPNGNGNAWTQGGELILRTQSFDGNRSWRQGYARSNWRVQGGIFQARIALPPSSPNGLSGAFWLQSIQRINGINYEFDIQELIPMQNGANWHYHEMSTNLHALNSSNVDTWDNGTSAMVYNPWMGDSWWASNYHTYTLEWNTTSAYWYVDGVRVRGMWLSSSGVPQIQSWGGSITTMPRSTYDALLGNPMYIIFDQEIFSWAGIPTSAGPWDMKVDYFARWSWR